MLLLAFVLAVWPLERAAAQEPQPPTGMQAALALEQTVVEAIAKAEGSVVAIARVKARRDQAGPALGRLVDPFERFRPPSEESNPTSPSFIPHEFGTGVVIDRRGLILTQYHVVQEGDEHWVTTSDRKVYAAKIKAADPRSELAVLQIDASDLTPIRLGDAARLRKGQIVIALGNPYAIARDGQVSASWGIVANLARKAGPIPDEEPINTKPTLHHSGTLIQTDARLNLGTSGGALIDLHGEMVGLTTSLAATAGFENAAGYAVPVDDTFKRVIEVLKEGREVEYGFLGVGTQDLGWAEKRQGKQGMRVSIVVEGTPAQRAGLRADDVISHVNERPIYDADGLMLEIGRQPADSAVRLTVHRAGRILELHAQLAKYPVRGKKIVTTPAPVWRGLRVDYSTALTEFERRAMSREIDPEGCVLVSSVDENSPAWNEGLRPAMFISHVGGLRVTKPQEFLAAVADREGPVRIRLTLPEDQQPFRTIPPEG